MRTSENHVRQSPAARIITRFGGLAKAARAWSKPKSTVQRWKASGYIHPDYFENILRAAVVENVTLDPEDFNLVDVTHPAFNAPGTPGPDGTGGHTSGSSGDPTSETPRLPNAAVDRRAGALSHEMTDGAA